MKKLLLHLDTDSQPSAFDQVVAYDSTVDNIIAYGGVTPNNVTAYVHGMIFTRGGNNLKNSAIFIGGSNVADSDQVANAVKKAFFGPVRVSVMLDPNGSNTTAAAIARKVMHNYDIKGKKVVILGAGPVGQRAALYFLKEGAAQVVITSRSLERAKIISNQMKETYGVELTPAEIRNDVMLDSVLQNTHVVIASGPAGVCVLPKSSWEKNKTLEVVADVNAVPPLGIEDVGVMDNGELKHNIRFYGAIAIGNFKMKIHRRAVASLFDSNEQFIDETSIYDIACDIDS